jgi:outer membrane lipoprotein-sorting protein
MSFALDLLASRGGASQAAISESRPGADPGASRLPESAPPPDSRMAGVRHVWRRTEMLRFIQRVSAATLVAGLLSAAGLAADLETVEKDIFEKMKATKTVQAKLTINADMSDEHMKRTMTGQGQVLAARHDNKLYQRSEQKLSQTMKVGDQDMSQEITQMLVSDGEWTYTVADVGMGKQCNKFRNPPEEPMPFQDFRASYDLSLLPEETIDGAPCYVIQATPKPNTPQASMQSKIVLCYRKDSGFSVRTAMYNAEGKQALETKFTDIVLNKDIPMDQFKAPEGVECGDVTEQMQAMMRAAAGEGAGTQPSGN